jgi:hypothetical protein
VEVDWERWIKPAIALIAIFFWLMGRRRERSTPASPPPTQRPASRPQPSSPQQSVVGEVSNRPIHPR